MFIAGQEVVVRGKVWQNNQFHQMREATATFVRYLGDTRDVEIIWGGEVYTCNRFQLKHARVEDEVEFYCSECGTQLY